MHYLIAGGGDFGTRYLRKLNIARKRRNLPIESITVIDNNPDCKAKKFVERISNAQIEVADLLEFGNAVWLRRKELKEATWVLSFPRFSGHYLKGGYDVQNADQISG